MQHTTTINVHSPSTTYNYSKQFYLRYYETSDKFTSYNTWNYIFQKLNHCVKTYKSWQINHGVFTTKNWFNKTYSWYKNLNSLKMIVNIRGSNIFCDYKNVKCPLTCFTKVNSFFELQKTYCSYNKISRTILGIKCSYTLPG